MNSETVKLEKKDLRKVSLLQNNFKSRVHIFSKMTTEIIIQEL